MELCKQLAPPPLTRRAMLQRSGAGFGALVGLPSFLLMIGISALEILVAGIQAYVFALLTSLYINDAEHLH